MAGVHRIEVYQTYRSRHVRERTVPYDVTDLVKRPTARSTLLLDVVILACLVVFLSILLGGPIELSPWRRLPVHPVAVAALAALLWGVRRYVRPTPGVWSDSVTRIRHWLQQRATRLGFQVAAVSRCALLLVGLLAVSTIGHARNTGPPPPDEVTFLPGRWDASWYVGVAAGGYRWEGPDRHNSRLAFFPAFPMSLRVVGRILHLPQTEPPWLWTGVVLSTVFFALALSYLYRLGGLLIGPAVAHRTVLLLAAYPFALFFGQVYSESLFLLATVAATYHAAVRQPLTAALFGTIAGLTRPTGSLVVLLLVWGLLLARRADPSSRLGRADFVAVVSPVIGTVMYSAYVRGLTGDWLTWLTDQEGWGRSMRDPVSVVLEIGTFIARKGFDTYLLERPYELLNVVAALLAMAAVIPLGRRLGVAPALYVLLSVLAPLRVGGFASMGRYTCVLFPLFIYFAASRKGWFMPGIIFLALLQGLLAALFFTDRPVF
jgi:hypothetical protein